MALQINFVWFNTNPMGGLEKFNIYSWKALGHNVTVYACKWDGSAPNHLGLDHGVRVVDLNAHVHGDVVQNAPPPTKARQILVAWLDYAAQHPPDGGNLGFNIGDLSKSYIASTQTGIVMDLKIGPSPHVQAYEDAHVFTTKFVSFTRDTNTPGGKPENQCMGSMQAGGGALRTAYATKFDGMFAMDETFQNYLTNPTSANYGSITQQHGAAAIFRTVNFFNLSQKNPDGTPGVAEGRNAGQYVVREIQFGHSTEHSYGPLRVFKLKQDQSNKPGAPKTTKEMRQELAQWVWDNELHNKPNNNFLQLAHTAINTIT